MGACGVRGESAPYPVCCTCVDGYTHPPGQAASQAYQYCSVAPGEMIEAVRPRFIQQLGCTAPINQAGTRCNRAVYHLGVRCRALVAKLQEAGIGHGLTRAITNHVLCWVFMQLVCMIDWDYPIPVNAGQDLWTRSKTALAWLGIALLATNTGGLQGPCCRGRHLPSIAVLSSSGPPFQSKAHVRVL